ncbi:hypothetical protein ACIA74_45010 [Streptomyces sp. NPDC051658]|uniref:hypothetical protein n=1 Tax=Streptomyces sp. NPDC051658 TaxID=3365667 RepID=UPI00379E9F35
MSNTHRAVALQRANSWGDEAVVSCHPRSISVRNAVTPDPSAPSGAKPLIVHTSMQ